MYGHGGAAAGEVIPFNTVFAVRISGKALPRVVQKETLPCSVYAPLASAVVQKALAVTALKALLSPFVNFVRLSRAQSLSSSSSSCYPIKP
jgi:hypothetical protein